MSEYQSIRRRIKQKKGGYLTITSRCVHRTVQISNFLMKDSNLIIQHSKLVGVAI